MLVHGRGPVALYSNYSREDSVLWNGKALRQAYRPRIVRPGTSGNGVAIELG